MTSLLNNIISTIVTSIRRQCNVHGKERNIPAALCIAFSVVLLCSSLVFPRWFFVNSQLCNLGSVGLFDILTTGHFQLQFYKEICIEESCQTHSNIVFSSHTEKLVNCLDEKILELIRLIVACNFVAFTLSVFDLCINIIGVSGRVLIKLKQNAILSILTVLCCAVIVILCYFGADMIEKLRTSYKEKNVEVGLDVAFYLVTAAGATSVLATACNLFLVPNLTPERSLMLLDDCNCLDTVYSGPNNQFLLPPPPPPYSP